MTARPSPGRLGPLLVLVGPHRRELRYAIVSGVVHGALFVAGATTAAYLMGRAVTGAQYNQIYGLLLLVAVLVLPQVRTPWVESAVLHSVAFRMQVELRDTLYATFAALSPAQLQGHRSGDLASAVVSDIDVLQAFFAEAFGPLFVAPVVSVLALGALAAISWVLGLVLLPFLVAAAGVPWWLHQRPSRRPSDPDGAGDPRAAVGDLNAEVVDAVQGLREVLAFGHQDRVLAELDRRADRASAAEVVAAGGAGTRRAVADALAAAGALAVLAAGLFQAADGTLSRPLLLAAAVLAAVAFAPLTRLAVAAAGLEGATAAAQRLVVLLATPPAVVDAALPDGPRPGELAPSVAFDHVTYRYRPDLTPAVEDVSFHLPAGSTVALVGHSGAGKSTCASLLLRFADVEAGAITIGGVDIRELPADRLRQLVAFVSQDVYLFHASIADNLRLGRPDAADAEIQAAAAAAQADEFIAALPDGYQSRLGERGATLSGGQRQRLAIARALVQDPPILVLDEPVSNLDSESEQALRAAMERLRSGRTTLVIAHRVSTIAGADTLVVLDHGRVACIGAYPDLVAAGLDPMTLGLPAADWPAG